MRVRQDKHTIRDAFERDRDRIMYSKAFRRLSGKTQVFLADKDDHTRNRLTHTLEVSQIARTIAKALGLNETLTEAIALGHDIGHTPFGHVGERMLHRIMSGCYIIKGFEDVQGKEGNSGFKHNWQSIKVASLLEQEESLNLTKETLWGMLHHSKLEYGDCDHQSTDGKCYFRVDKYDSDRECNKRNETELSYYKNLEIWNGENEHLTNLNQFLKDGWTIEAYIVAIADEIAQRHHDIEDAIEYRILGMKELKEKLNGIFGSCNEAEGDYYRQEEVQDSEEWKRVENCKEGEKEQFIAALSKYIVNLLTSDAIYHTAYKLRCIKKRYGVGQYIIRQLFLAYVTNPQQLPNSQLPYFFNKYYYIRYKCGYKKALSDEKYLLNSGWDIGKMRDELQGLHSGKHNEEYQAALTRTICDYIAGMTDKHAIEKHRQLYNIEYR